jgi:hypothetical protein
MMKTRATSFDSLRARVLSVLTDQPQHLRQIAAAARVTTYEAAIALADLVATGDAARVSATRAEFVRCAAETGEKYKERYV